MSELGHEAKSLVKAGQGAFRPSTGDRERNLYALRARLGDGGATAGGGSTLPSASAAGLSWPVLSAVVVGLAVVGGLLVTSLRSSETQGAGVPTVVVPAAPASVGLVAPEPPKPTTVAPVATTLQPAPVEASAAEPRRQSDRLAEEVAILSRAETELHASRFASALRVLDEHQRKFPKGALAQERHAARIRALCALGRVSEAEKEIGRLTRSSPQSPHEGPSRAACAALTKN